MTTASHGGSGGTPRSSFSDTLFPEPGLELGKARPSASSLEEIAPLAVLDGGDAGEMGSPAQSVASPRVAVGDGRIEARSPSRSSLSWPGSHSAMAAQVVKIKEEEVEDEEAGMVADPGDATAMSPSCSWRAAAEEVVRPMEGLGEVGPTPFLRKTYEMVSDPGSDPVVSWGSGRDSFVVWDQHEFSKQVLPRYFKHSNFSSFIRQLNTYVECDPLGASSYSSPSQQIVPGAKRLGSKGFHSRRFAQQDVSQGFRKIDTERWEFANEGFQAGKKHLLKNIKRRGKFSKHRKTSSSNFTSGYPKAGKEAVLETLKKDQEALKAEILKLREERENSQHEIDQVAEQVRCAECRHQQMFLFLYKAAKSPNFVQQLIQKRRHKRELDTRESSKKSKLLDPDGATQCLLEAMDPKIQSPNVDCLTISDESAQMESQPNSVVLEDFETIQMHNPWPSPLGGRDFRVGQGQTPDQMAGASPSHLSSVFHEMSERLLEDNMVVGDNVGDVEEVEDLGVNDSRIYLELEGLIEKPCGWSEYPSGLMEQAEGLMP